MLKKTVSYESDGTQHIEDLYFNLTSAELVKLAMKEGEGFEDYITKTVASGDPAKIIELFEKILGLAYGQKIDGKFVKRAGAFEEFTTTEAYSILFMELITDAKKSAEFVNGIMPAELIVQAQKAQDEIGISQNLQDHLSLPDSGDMTDEELRAALGVQAEPEVVMTGGFTDQQILQMSGKDLAKQTRNVLIRAYWLKQNQ